MTDPRADRPQTEGEHANAHPPAAQPSGESVGANVRIGVAGWSYPDWRGIVYPSRPPPEYSELAEIARQFDCVEINTSFYGDVSPRTAERWVRTVEEFPDFRFTAKVHRDLTHGSDPARGSGLAPDELRQRARLGRRGLEPLRAAGRFAGIVVQFPWHFADTPEHREHLRILADELAGDPVFVELRHRSFLSTGPNGGLPFLESLGLDFVNIDLPESRTSPGLGSVNTGRFGYFRLHGRNAKSWFDRSAGRDDKYDYLYTVEELLLLVPCIERVAARAHRTFVIANNHFRGQAVANALQLAGFLRRTLPPPSAEMRARYPFLTPPGERGAS